MFKKILLGLAAIIAAFLAIVAMQPANFRITRAVTISAPPETVFVQVNDFHKWEAWSPWAKIDPAMKQTYEGSPSGVGAVSKWAGNNEVGEGSMTIVESRPSELIQIKLEFLKPFVATNAAEFTFTPNGARTDVMWSMTGTNNFMGKAVALCMNMDKMVGGQFAQGLTQLKAVAEEAPKF